MPLFGFWEILKKSTQPPTGSRYSMSTIVGMSLVSAVLEGCVKPHSFSLLKTWNHLRGPDPDSDLAPLRVGLTLTALSHPSWVPNLLLDFLAHLKIFLSLYFSFLLFPLCLIFLSHTFRLSSACFHIIAWAVTVYLVYVLTLYDTVVSALLTSAWWTCSPARQLFYQLRCLLNPSVYDF